MPLDCLRSEPLAARRRVVSPKLPYPSIGPYPHTLLIVRFLIGVVLLLLPGERRIICLIQANAPCGLDLYFTDPAHNNS